MHDRRDRRQLLRARRNRRFIRHIEVQVSGIYTVRPFEHDPDRASKVRDGARATAGEYQPAEFQIILKRTLCTNAASVIV